MKKEILLLKFLIIGALTFAAENQNSISIGGPIETLATTNLTESPIQVAIPIVMSKGDSFMMAFGMGSSSVVTGGESGGTTSSAPVATAATSVASTIAHTSSTALNSIQNTPYSNK